MTVVGSCPGCGAPLEFRVATSVVAVCEFCRQVVARGGAGVENLGKSNEILALPSALKLGARGTFARRAFTVVGRTQLAHPLGGHWNEWYAVLDDGRWAWIAEHQGRIAVLAEVPAAQAPQIRSLDAAEPGSRWLSGRGEFVVAERGIATIFAEEGELPWRAAPRERRAYVDLSSPGGGFATLDFGPVGDDERPRGPTRFYAGKEVAPQALGIADAPVVEQKRVAGARAVQCPKCAAPLALKRPDDTMTLVCSSCGSALSVDENKDLGFLYAQTIGVRPKIPLGTRGRLDGAVLKGGGPAEAAPFDVEVVAFVQRSVWEEGEQFFFYEYLLASEQRGYWWLVDTEGKWLLFHPVEAAAVTVTGRQARYDGLGFHEQAQAQPEVEQVLGELYWRVERGAKSQSVDYQAGNKRLTVEKTRDEVNWTYGWQVPASPVAAAFGLPHLSSLTSGGGGSPFGESEYASSGWGNSEVSPAGMKLIFLGLFILIALMATCDDCDGVYVGGVRSGYGGGSSFGK